MRKRENLSGQKFGALTVIKRAGTQKGRTMYQCLCDCGSIHYAEGSNLKAGRITNCGCKLKGDNIILKIRLSAEECQELQYYFETVTKKDLEAEIKDFILEKVL